MTRVRPVGFLHAAVQCPACRGRDLRPSSKRAPWLVRVFGVNRFRCRTCGRRVLLRGRA